VYDSLSFERFEERLNLFVQKNCEPLGGSILVDKPQSSRAILLLHNARVLHGSVQREIGFFTLSREASQQLFFSTQYRYLSFLH
jgi:hypothetical protein